MSVAATRRELDKVKLESQPVKRRDEPDSASETESDVTELGEDEDEPEYYPDAIKWARYRDSHGDRPDGWKGWHYGVMWTGYLKTFSDTEEPFDMFATDESGRNQMLEDFWNGVGRPMTWKKDKSGMKEPKGKLKEIVFPPEDLMKCWLADARPRRSYKLFKIREEKERALSQGKIQKRDSDYYWYRGLKAKAKAKAEREAARVAAQAGPSKLGKIPQKTASAINTPVDSEDEEEEAKRKAKARKAKAGSASLDTLFADDAKAKAEQEKRKKEVEALLSEDEVESAAQPVLLAKVEKKRKAASAASTPDVGTSKAQARGPSPPKKQKSPAPVVSSAPKTAPAPTPNPATAPVNKPGPTPSAAPIEPAPIAPSAPISIPSRALANKGTLATAPAPVPAAQVSPSTTLHNRTSIPTPSKPKDKEPLFLAGGASPIDATSKSLSPVDTFGAPLPGILFVPSYMSGHSDNDTSAADIKPIVNNTGKGVSPSATASAAATNTVTAPTSSLGLSVTQPPADKAPSPPVVTPMSEPASASLAPVAIQVTAPTPKAVSKAPGLESTPSKAPGDLTVKTGLPIPSSSNNVAVATPSTPTPVSTQPAVPIAADVAKSAMPPTPITSGPPIDSMQTTDDIDMPSPTTQSPLRTSPGSAPVSPISNAAPGPSKSASISPPRYGQGQPARPKVPQSPTLSMSPPKTASKPLSPTGSTSPIKASVAIADRPKYVQPKLVKVMDAIVDPEAEARRQKLAARKGSHPTPSHPTLPVRPSTVVPQTASSRPRPPSTAPPPLPSPVSIPFPQKSGPSRPPQQPKSWGGQTPIGPSAVQARPAGGYGSGVGYPDQSEAFRTNNLQAPWVQRQQQHGGGSPAAPYQNASPMWNNGGGASPITHTDRWTPNAQIPSQLSNLSPQWASTHNAPQPPPGFPGHRPTYQQAPRQAIDPRSASASPMIHNASPMGHMGNQTPIPQAFYPRRPSQPPQTPLQNVPRSPDGGGSSASGSRRIDTLGRIALRLDYQDHVHRLNVSRGAYPAQLEDGDAILHQVLGDGSTEISLNMDDVDLSLVNWQIRQFGARVVQWAKVGCPDTDKGRRAQWDKLKTQSHGQGKTWIAYTELPHFDESVTAHYALIVTDSSNVQAELLGPGLGLGPWSSTKEVGIALIVLALPLDSADPSVIPDPVRPDVHGFELDIKPKHDMVLDQMHLLASYGLLPQYFASLSGRPAVTYPPKDGDYDVFRGFIEREYRNHGVKPHDASSIPDHVLFDNAKMGRAVKSTTIRHTVNRRTQYFAAGPSLHLPPSQWVLKEIWRTGGLVTFTPDFILRHPKKFGEIMKLIRTAPNWAAYIIPEVVQWVETSLKMPAYVMLFATHTSDVLTNRRCPEPTEAFQAFSKSLFLDQQLLQLSGSKACSGGGLAVSTCPPLNSEVEKCAAWLDWLSRAINQTEYKSLVKLCFDYTSALAGTANQPPVKKGDMGMDMDVDMPEPELALVDIETKQIEDLTHLRMRPHCVPYRRFIHIGATSLEAQKRDRISTGIERVEPDSFAALLSGAI